MDPNLSTLSAIQYAKMAAYIGAAVAIAIGTIAPALSQGFIGVKGIEGIAKNPENASEIRGPMFLAMALVETSSVFALLVALLLIFYS